MTFENTKTNEVVIAYRGTNGPFDVVADIQLVAGQIPQQFLDARNYYDTVIAKYDPANVSVTGHSLGGAMASFVTASEDVATTATAFNAPGIAKVLVGGNYPNVANVTNYNAFFDFASNLTANQIGVVYTVGRSRYAEESPAAAPRIILHLHPLDAEGFDCAIFREDKPA